METEEMADSSVSEAAGKLMDVSTEELGLFVGAADELEQLKNTYLSIQDIIYDAKQRQIFDYSLQRWLSELENEADELYKLLEEYYQISDAASVPTKNKKNELCGCLHFISDYMQDFILRRKMAVQIKKIRKLLDENVYEKERFSSENVYENQRLSSECRDDSPAAIALSFRGGMPCIPLLMSCISFFKTSSVKMFLSNSSQQSSESAIVPSPSHSISQQSSECQDSAPLLLSNFRSEYVSVTSNSSSSRHRHDSPAADATSFPDEPTIKMTISEESADSTRPLPSWFVSENVYVKSSSSPEYRCDSPAANAPSFQDESIIILEQDKESVIPGESEESKQLLLARLKKEFDEFDNLLQDRLMAAASSGRNKNKKKACECLYSIVDYVQHIIPRRDGMEIRSKNIRERYDRLLDEVRAAKAGGDQNRSSNQM